MAPLRLTDAGIPRPPPPGVLPKAPSPELSPPVDNAPCLVSKRDFFESDFVPVLLVACRLDTARPVDGKERICKAINAWRTTNPMSERNPGVRYLKMFIASYIYGLESTGGSNTPVSAHPLGAITSPSIAPTMLHGNTLKRECGVF